MTLASSSIKKSSSHVTSLTSFLRDRNFSGYLEGIALTAGGFVKAAHAAGVATVSSLVQRNKDEQKEQILWAGFDVLFLNPTEAHIVLILQYAEGFQVWDVQESSNVKELVSRRDGPSFCLRLLPYPESTEILEGSFRDLSPLLALATQDDEDSNQEFSVSGGNGGNPIFSVVKFYSLKTHSYVHRIKFGSAVSGIRCNKKILAVSLSAQIYCLSTSTLESLFSVLTYPYPSQQILQVPTFSSSYSPPVNTSPSLTSPPQIPPILPSAPLALSPKWLAYPANQPLFSTPGTGKAFPQPLGENFGPEIPQISISPSSLPLGDGVRQLAKERGRQLAAGIVTLGEMGWRRVAKYMQEGGNIGGNKGENKGSFIGSFPPGLGTRGAFEGKSEGEDFAGMVMIRDISSRSVVAHFKAHNGPISALEFNQSGELLVTASVSGHTLNVFSVSDGPPRGPISKEQQGNVVHLYKLHRGVTSALIQSFSWSPDSQWLAATSSHGTTHIYAVLPAGGPIGPHTHATSSPHNIFDLTRHHSLNPISLSVISRIKHPISPHTSSLDPVAALLRFPENTLKFPSDSSSDSPKNASETSSQSPEPPLDSFQGGGPGVQLWLLSPGGFLVRYFLKPYAEPRGGATNYTAPVPPGGGGIIGGLSGGSGFRLRLGVKPIERWDVARRKSWEEREENLETFVRSEVNAGENVEGNGSILRVQVPSFFSRVASPSYVEEEKKALNCECSKSLIPEGKGFFGNGVGSYGDSGSEAASPLSSNGSGSVDFKRGFAERKRLEGIVGGSGVPVEGGIFLLEAETEQETEEIESGNDSLRENGREERREEEGPCKELKLQSQENQGVEEEEEIQANGWDKGLFESLEDCEFLEYISAFVLM